MGGLISMYAVIQYQAIFSKAGIFSPAFWFSDSLYTHIEQTNMTEDVRIYFVAGTQESSTMSSNIIMMEDLLLGKGVPQEDLRILLQADGVHNEGYWAREYPAAYTWLFEENATSSTDPLINSYTIFPNPTHKFLNIDTPQDETFDFRVFSLWGVEFDTARVEHGRLDVGHLMPGTYFLQVWKEGQQLPGIYRFVKH
jgi:hypothetical protein